MNVDARPAWSRAAPEPVIGSASPRGTFARKKMRWALVRWALFGSHYLYLRRPFTQLLFWMTLGGLLFWWLLDLTRLSHLVRQHNERAFNKLIARSHDRLEQSLRDSDWRPLSSGIPALALAMPLPVENVPTEQRQKRSRFELRPAALAVVCAACMTAIGLYVLNPPSIYPSSREAPR